MKTTPNSIARLILLPLLAVVFALNAFAQNEENEETPEKQAPPKIRKLIVNFTGLSNVNEEVARANMSVRVGDDYIPIELDRDVRTLYRTGLFEYIEQRIRVVSSTEVDVIFDIRPKFRISSVGFDGNEKFSDRRLEREVEVLPNQVLNERKVNDAAKALKEYYTKRGYSQARVDYEVDRNPATGFGNVVFKINEGRKFKIKNIKFTGRESIKKRKLKGQMKTKKWSILSVFAGTGKLDSDQFEDDLEQLRDTYRQEGFLDIDIDPSQVKFSYPSKSRMLIDINIDEGRQYKIGSITFEGNELQKDDLLRIVVSAKPGDVYRPERLDEDVGRIEDFYGQLGYMETSVRPRRVPNTTTGDIDIVFTVYESERFQVESIDIEGNTKTKSIVVIRELPLYPGSTFDSVRMEAAKMRLENSRYFEDVNVTPQTTHIPNRRDLRITFQEGRTGNFSFGAGFSSLEKGVFFVELTQSNFDIFNWRGAFQGDGQKFRLRAQLGSESNQLVLAFEEPWLFEKRLAAGFQIFRTSNGLSGLYDVEQEGFEIYFRKRLIELIETRVAYSQNTFKFSDFDSSLSPEQIADLRTNDGKLNSMNILLRRDTRDRFLNTFSGARFEWELTSAGQFLGGSFDYNKFEVRNAFWVPISQWHKQTIRFDINAGVVKQTGDTLRVPTEERFYLGGPDDLRGFEFRDVSPKQFGIVFVEDEEGNPIDPVTFRAPIEVGGKTYGLFSAEYTIGFTDGFHGAIFYDGGFVNKAAGDFSFDQDNVVSPDGILQGWHTSGWNDNFGVGIRISVMGTPLRLDYGIPLTTSGSPDIGGNDNGAQFNFTFGGRF